MGGPFEYDGSERDLRFRQDPLTARPRSQRGAEGSELPPLSVERKAPNECFPCLRLVTIFVTDLTQKSDSRKRI